MFFLSSGVTAQTAIWHGTSITAGGNTTYPDRDSFWALGRDYLQSVVNTFLWNEYNRATGGTNTYYALIKFAATTTALAPKTLLMDWSNDNTTALLNMTEEALIRRLRTESPDTNMLVVIMPSCAGGTLVTPPQHAQFRAICDHYAVPYIDCHALMVAIVAGGGSLDNYYTSPDYVHPNVAGNAWIHAQTKAALISIAQQGRQWSGNLTDYSLITAGSDDLCNTPTVKLGTAYDSRTGSWSDSGSVVISSEAGATITYSAICRSIGRYASDGAYSNTVEVSIDGGAYAAMAFTKDGVLLSGARAAHTIAIKVVSGQLRIDEFWAI